MYRAGGNGPRLLRRPGLYVRWARTSLAVYQGVTYSRGKVGAWVDRHEAAVARAQPYLARSRSRLS